MPSPFDDLMADVDASIMDAFGETEEATLRPRLNSQYAARATDPARPEQGVCGVFSAGPEVTELRGVAKHEFAGTTRLSSMSAEFWLAPEQVAALGYEIAVGDLIEFPCRGGARYSVSAIQRTDTLDRNLILSAEDDQT